MKTVIFAKDVNLSKLVEMLKICPCCKYVSNLYQTITFTSLLRINTYLANICICPHFSRQRKCNANLELQIYHIFAPFANISKSVFSYSVYTAGGTWNYSGRQIALLSSVRAQRGMRQLMSKAVGDVVRVVSGRYTPATSTCQFLTCRGYCRRVLKDAGVFWGNSGLLVLLRSVT